MVSNYAKLSLLVSATVLLTSTLPRVALAGPASFNPPVDYRVGDHPQCVAVGDFNHDGLKDLAASNAVSNTVSVLLGNADGTFQAPRTFPVGNGPASVAVGDFNGDGIQDLATTDYQSNTISVLLGIGDGNFGPTSSFPAGGTNPNFVVVADFNGDGAQDLAVADFGGGASNSKTVAVFLGVGNGSFQPALTFDAERSPIWVDTGDFNGDGRPDLVVANFNADSVSVLLGNGDGTFQAARNFPATGAASIAIDDFNRDGMKDLAVADYFGNRVSVLLGNGDGTFRPALMFGVGSGPVDVEAGDFNRDGVQDLAVTNWDHNSGQIVSLLMGNGDGTFQAAQNIIAGGGVVAVAVDDFNGDGAQDMVVANYNSGTLSVFMNSTASAGYSLTVSQAGTGSGTVTSSPAGIDCGATCSASYDSGTVVTLTATPSGGSTFTGWSGGGCSGTGACTVAMSAATAVTATFTRPTFTLSVTKESVLGIANGTVTSSPAGISCGAACSATFDGGTTVTLTAMPDPLSVFVGWSGGGCSGTGTCNVTLGANTTITASFKVLGVI